VADSFYNVWRRGQKLIKLRHFNKTGPESLLNQKIDPNSGHLNLGISIHKGDYEKLLDYSKASSQTLADATISIIDKGIENY